MSSSEITPAPPRVPVVDDESGQTAQANLKGPFAITQVNESIQREQHGLGPFVSKKGKKPDSVVYEQGAEPQRHFRLLSLSMFSARATKSKQA